MNKKELIDHLLEVYKEVGRIPTTLHLRWYKGQPQYDKYVKAFGSWENAIKKLRERLKNEVHRK